MPLREFNHENSTNQPESSSFISIGRDGKFNFSKRLLRKSGLKPGDKVVFLQDKSRPKDWYISRSPKGFELYRVSSTVGFVAAIIGTEIKDSLNLLKKTAIQLPIAGEWVEHEGREVLPIITSAVKVTQPASTAPDRNTKRRKINNQPCLN